MMGWFTKRKGTLSIKREEKSSFKVLIAILSVSLLVLGGLLTETAINIAFPALMKEYAVSASSVQWLTMGKMLVVAVITPICDSDWDSLDVALFLVLLVLNFVFQIAAFRKTVVK